MNHRLLSTTICKLNDDRDMTRIPFQNYALIYRNRTIQFCTFGIYGVNFKYGMQFALWLHFRIFNQRALIIMMNPGINNKRTPHTIFQINFVLRILYVLQYILYNVISRTEKCKSFVLFVYDSWILIMMVIWRGQEKRTKFP